jgi:GNAT superfamily N-acetyltransferase
MKEVLTKEFAPRKKAFDGRLMPPPSSGLELEFGIVEPDDERLLTKCNWLMMNEFGKSFNCVEEAQGRAEKGEIIACVERGGALVGMADIGPFPCPYAPESMANNILFLNHIAVEEEYRRRYAKIGVTLFNYVAKLAHERGFSEMTLQAIDTEENWRFYRKKLRLTSVPDDCAAYCDYCLLLSGEQHCFEA